MDSRAEAILRQYRSIPTTSPQDIERAQELLREMSVLSDCDLSDYAPAGRGASVGAFAIWAAIGSGTPTQAKNIAPVENQRMKRLIKSVESGRW